MRVKLPPQKPREVGNFAATRPCVNSNCQFYGTLELDYHCSKCYNARLPPQQKGNQRNAPSNVKDYIENETLPSSGEARP